MYIVKMNEKKMHVVKLPGCEKVQIESVKKHPKAETYFAFEDAVKVCMYFNHRLREGGFNFTMAVEECCKVGGYSSAGIFHNGPYAIGDMVKTIKAKDDVSAGSIGRVRDIGTIESGNGSMERVDVFYDVVFAKDRDGYHPLFASDITGA